VVFHRCGRAGRRVGGRPRTLRARLLVLHDVTAPGRASSRDLAWSARVLLTTRAYVPTRTAKPHQFSCEPSMALSSHRLPTYRTHRRRAAVTGSGQRTAPAGAAYIYELYILYDNDYWLGQI
jgi:hypothetical protein